MRAQAWGGEDRRAGLAVSDRTDPLPTLNRDISGPHRDNRGRRAAPVGGKVAAK